MIYTDAQKSALHLAAIALAEECMAVPALPYDKREDADAIPAASYTWLIHFWIHALRLLEVDATERKASLVRMSWFNREMRFRFCDEVEEFVLWWSKLYGQPKDMAWLLCEHAVGHQLTEHLVQTRQGFTLSAEINEFLEEMNNE